MKSQMRARHAESCGLSGGGDERQGLAAGAPLAPAPRRRSDAESASDGVDVGFGIVKMEGQAHGARADGGLDSGRA